MWSVVANLAACAHGAVSRRALLEAGLSGSEVDSFVRSGQLERRGHGVYVVAGSPPTPMQDVAVAVLGSGDGARAAGARMLGQLGVRDVPLDAAWCVLVPRGRRLRAASYPWRVDRFPGLGTQASVLGVPGFTVARTLLEAAADEQTDRDLRLLADGVRWRSGSLRDVAELVDAAPTHRGARRLMQLGVLDADAAESEQERGLEAVLAPYPLRRQVQLTPKIRVDFLLVGIDVVVEYQGAHHRARHQREADSDRAVAIRGLGHGYVEAWANDLRDPTSLFSRIAGEVGGPRGRGSGRSQ